MNARERFHATMHYQQRDRCPIMDFGFWDETTVVWHQQGLPTDVDTDSYFGMDPQWYHCGGNTQLCPAFPEQVLQDLGASAVLMQGDGVVVEKGKFMGSIPRHIRHTLTDRESWQEHYLHRLRPDSPERFPDPDRWRQLVHKWTDPNRDYPLFITAGSLYGRMRNWFGLERVSEIIYDDRPLFEEIVERQADVICEVLKHTLEAGVRPEAASMWEDMCYNSGPLISPRLFRQVLVPQYRRISGLLRRYGVDIIFVDCDGDIRQLAPLWLEAGINTMFPVEVGTWGQDPMLLRREYGREMRLIGGIDKRILARGPDAITAEVERLAPLVEEGGYIPLCDHRVPPDVPLAYYLHYLRTAKSIWGHGAEHCRPTPVTPDAALDYLRQVRPHSLN